MPSLQYYYVFVEQNEPGGLRVICGEIPCNSISTGLRSSKTETITIIFVGSSANPVAGVAEKLNGSVLKVRIK